MSATISPDGRWERTEGGTFWLEGPVPHHKCLRCGVRVYIEGMAMHDIFHSRLGD